MWKNRKVPRGFMVYVLNARTIIMMEVKPPIRKKRDYWFPPKNARQIFLSARGDFPRLEEIFLSREKIS